MAAATAARVRAVQSISDAALARLEPDELYRELLGRLREELHADAATLLDLEEEQGVLQVRASVGLEEAVHDRVQIPLGEGVAGRIAASRQPMIVEDVTAVDAHSPWLRERICSLMGVPLIVGDQVVGVLHVGVFEHRRFTDDELRLLELAASRIALAVDRADLFEAERRARTEAQEANAAKDQFVAMVSHELRNPLSAIQAGVDVLRRELPQAEGRAGRAVEIISRNTAMQARLVNDLLDLSRIARGKLQFQRAPILLRKVVCGAVEDQQGEVERAGVILKIDTEPDLWVQGDFERLQQVVLNLLSNALKFTPAGGEVRVSARGADGKGCIAVEDTGIGIDQKLLQRLFAMFQQGEVAGQRQPGLGLGLALVKVITEKHGGRVWAESDGPGKGSRFTVELPLVSGPPSTPTERWQARRSGSIRLLLVEDNADTLAMLDESLRRDGYEVQAAASAEDALALLKQWQPDVILSDIGLPGADGYEFLLRVRQMPGMADVPAFAVTGYGAEEDVRRAREAGYAGHFVKPVNLTTLDERIREWVGARAVQW